MMINKKFVFILLICFTKISFATPRDMGNVQISGYFDNDTYLDLLRCSETKSYGRDKTKTDCVIRMKDKDFILKIDGNDDCVYLEFQNPKTGQLLVKCGINGIDQNLYYEYDDKLNNWFLTTRNILYWPTGPNDAGEEKTQNNLQEQISIDRKIVKIRGNDTLLSLENIIKNHTYKQQISMYQKADPRGFRYPQGFKFFINDKDYLKALVKSVSIYHLNINNKNITNYNNIAYYLGLSGLDEEAITILEQVIRYNPTRAVAYLNLADLYANTNNTDDIRNAKKMYQKYKDLMVEYNKTDKIPKRIYRWLQ